MISNSSWDSEFFGRTIGQMELEHGTPTEVDRDLEQAARDGFAYVLCKLPRLDTALGILLESRGFYLCDAGVSYRRIIDAASMTPTPQDGGVRVAAEDDIPWLVELARTMFVHSRFYHDPFFTTEESNRLHEAWIENSVRGRAADVVLCSPEAGFVTCVSRPGAPCEIGLIGVSAATRRRGLGVRLVESASRWCLARQLHELDVRTQVRNTDAMNFYAKLGFRVVSCYTVFARVLAPNSPGPSRRPDALEPSP